ncbi:MAG: amino acid ABC transporter substrate-binding protein [Bacillota bacterium]
MRRFFSFVLLVAALAAAMAALTGCSALGGADRSWDKVKEKGELVMGLDDSFPPMGFRDENNELTGFDVDVAKEVCNRLGIKLRLQQIVWDTKEQELNTGNIDCIWNGFTITEERKENVLFTEPYMGNRQVLVVKSDSTLSKLSDFEGKRLALQAGSSAADALNAAVDFKSKLKEVVEFDENLTALMDLEKGGVDVVLMDEVVANYNISTGKFDIKVLDEALAPEEYGIGFRKNDVALMNKVQDTLKSMAKDGKLAEISEKWFGKDVTTIGK